MPSRRQALKTAAGAVAILPVLGQQHQHDAPATTTYKAKWATEEDMRRMAELCDLIIPRTDTPAASDARVHEYIDYTLSGSKRQQTAIRDGLKWFAALPPDKRMDALKAASQNEKSTEGRFFKRIKDLTIDGYYQSREGLVQELGWHGNTFLPEFKGCTHPEHKG